MPAFRAHQSVLQSHPKVVSLYFTKSDFELESIKLRDTSSV